MLCARVFFTSHQFCKNLLHLEFSSHIVSKFSKNKIKASNKYFPLSRFKYAQTYSLSINIVPFTFKYNGPEIQIQIYIYLYRRIYNYVTVKHL